MKQEVLQVLECQVVKLQSLYRTGRDVWPDPIREEMLRVANEILKAIDIERGPSTLELECYEKGDRIKQQIQSAVKY